MAEKMDEILRAVADRANAGVDYAAMRSGTLKKAQAKELALRKNIIRYGSVAAAAVLLASFGIGALSGGFFGMSAKSEAPDNAYFAVQDPAVPESEEQLFGSESATGGSAPTERANGGDDRGDAAAPSTPAATGAPAVEPPGCCGLDSASLYWAERALELPAVNFGKSSEVESDGEHYLLVVTGCTEEDFDAYVALIMEMYPDAEAQDEAVQSCCLSNTLKIVGGQYRVIVTLSDGEMRIGVRAIEN